MLEGYQCYERNSRVGQRGLGAWLGVAILKRVDIEKVVFDGSEVSYVAS